jgi:outer membrane protein
MILATILSLFSLTAVAANLDLQKSFEIAIQHNETVKIQEKTLEIAEERKSQATGSILPRVSAIGNYTKQDTNGLTASQRNSISEDNHSARLNATQTLFHGTQEYSALRAANRNIEAEEFTLSQRRRELYGQVATQFYALMTAEKDLNNLKTLLELSEYRANDLQKRARVGRVRKGELLQAQAQVAASRSLVIQAQNTLVQARTSFYQLTGIQEAQLVDTLVLPQKMAALESYLQKLEQRPDIQAYMRRTEAACENVNIAWGAHMPTLDLSGNYYLRREGSLENVKWDYGLTLTLPLFEGGVTQSKVREASAVYGQAEMNLALGRRTAEKQLRDLYSAVNDGKVQLISLAESAKLSEENYKEQTKDNRFGLVSSLEVLQALNTFIETKRSLDRVNSQVKTAYAQLRAATGEIN